MTEILHETHRWAERDGVPVCRDCRVEGYDDEPAAFAPCPSSHSTSHRVCWATMESRYLPGHTHLCETKPHEGDHICGECDRRFGTR